MFLDLPQLRICLMKTQRSLLLRDLVIREPVLLVDTEDFEPLRLEGGETLTESMVEAFDSDIVK